MIQAACPRTSDMHVVIIITITIIIIITIIIMIIITITMTMEMFIARCPQAPLGSIVLTVAEESGHQISQQTLALLTPV